MMMKILHFGSDDIICLALINAVICLREFTDVVAPSHSCSGCGY